MTPRRASRSAMASGRDGCLAFSLVELLFVLALAAVLIALAIPAYRGVALRMHRQEARSALLELARAQEWHYLANRAYASAGSFNDPPPAGLGAPATTESGRYTLSLDPASDATGFTVWAEARGNQLGDTRCVKLAVDSLGRRSALDAQGRAAADCWN